MEIGANDREQLRRKGISEEQLAEQLRMLKEGFPYLRLEGAATLDNGITRMSPEMEYGAIVNWEKFLQAGGRVMKMVPASGAASRMFKNLFSFVNGESSTPDTPFMEEFFEKIEEFAFFPTLNQSVMRLYGKSVLSLIAEGRYKEVVSALIGDEGMRYGYLPKALLQFHKIMGDTRTALEEHLAEGAQYAAGKDKKVKVHFTVSADHLELAKEKVEEVSAHLGHEYGVDYEISYSLQKSSTDTVASNLDGTPYREKGELFFRPGGHGALIENLNDLDSDVIFIKNIDNVVPDTHRGATIQYKKVLGGTLVAVKQRIDQYCADLEGGKVDESKIEEILKFMNDVLSIRSKGMEGTTLESKCDYAYGKLHRPLRVCGMVRNEGEPGGGPFMVYNSDGTVSPQILESTQIDHNDAEAEKMLQEATHFNPVDLAVSVTDHKGEKYDLRRYVDKATGFISQKSREGVEIKALELPGLWNGAMSDWNTIFVEVPAQTFNPVKTVNDLLRKAHQPLPVKVEG